MPFVSVPEAIEEIRSGRILVVVDDEDRENEDDLTIAAEKVTPEIINFMATHGRELIDVAEEVVHGARRVLQRTRKARPKDPIQAIAADGLREQIEHFCGLGSRVIDQARRRVLDGEQVPNPEKLYSIFEPHTDLIKRGKVR